MLRTWLMFLALTGAWLVEMTPVAAQVVGHPADCCRHCRRPRPRCCCAPVIAPVVCPPAVVCPPPVVCPQPVVSYRDVTETRIRQEQCVENVPVTTYRNVTVDEGSYQTVWVPKPVTKQVAQTSMTQQVKTRSVPYQVTVRVPTVSTALVTQPGVNCSGSSVLGHQPSMPGWSGTTTMVPAAPFAGTPFVSTESLPMMPAMTVPAPRSASLSTDFATPEGNWQTIAPRSTEQPYEPGLTRPVPRPDDAASVPRKTSMTINAPSAAMVWSSRSSLIR